MDYRFLETIFYVWNTACNTDFYKIPLPFIKIPSQKNAPFRNILLLRVRYISMSFFNVRPYTQLGKISQCLLINIMDFLIASGNHDK